MIDIIAYIGTVLLLGDIPLARRRNLHIMRAAGNVLWIVYAIIIVNWPLIITDVIALGMDLYAIHKFWSS